MCGPSLVFLVHLLHRLEQLEAVDAAVLVEVEVPEVGGHQAGLVHRVQVHPRLDLTVAVRLHVPAWDDGKLCVVCYKCYNVVLFSLVELRNPPLISSTIQVGPCVQIVGWVDFDLGSPPCIWVATASYFLPKQVSGTSQI